MTILRATGSHYCENGMILELGLDVPEPEGGSWYEVIRLIDGKFLFLPDHLERLHSSLFNSGMSFPGADLLQSYLVQLVRANKQSEGNVRICISEHKQGSLIRCYFIEHHYPTAEMYRTGVKLATFQYKRKEPGMKKWDQDFRKRVWSFIREKGIYEALLHNENGEISEGSRSNIFFINNKDEILTTPMDLVLPGITRKYVIDLAMDSGLSVSERRLELNELARIKAVFISGTSPKILPVCKIDELRFDPVHPLLNGLIEKFDQLIREHLLIPNV